jgi:hypothetical protein
MRRILGRHIAHAHPVGARGRGLRCRHDLRGQDRPGDDQHQDRSHHILLNVGSQSPTAEHPCEVADFHVA